METFFELNRDKLKAIFIRLSLVLIGPVSIALAIAYLTGNFPNRRLLFAIIIAAGVGFPLFIMLLGYMGWLIKRKARQNAFAKNPFNAIDSIGFSKSLTGDNSNWSFTDEIKEATVNGFTLKMDISKEKGNTIEFESPVEWKKLSKDDYSRLSQKFNQHGIDFRMGALVKHYDTKLPGLQNIYDLKKDLELFTTLLRQEGFEPKS